MTSPIQPDVITREWVDSLVAKTTEAGIGKRLMILASAANIVDVLVTAGPYARFFIVPPGVCFPALAEPQDHPRLQIVQSDQDTEDRSRLILDSIGPIKPRLTEDEYVDQIVSGLKEYMKHY